MDCNYVHEKIARIFVQRLMWKIILKRDTKLPTEIICTKYFLNKHTALLGDYFCVLVMLLTVFSAILLNIHAVAVAICGTIYHPEIVVFTEYILFVIVGVGVHYLVCGFLMGLVALLHYVCILKFLQTIPMSNSFEKVSDNRYKYIVADSQFISKLQGLSSTWLNNAIRHYRNTADYLNVVIEIEDACLINP